MIPPPDASNASAPRFRGLYRTLIVSLALPLIVIQVLLHHGTPAVIALSAGTIFPLGEMAYELARTKRVGIIAAASFIAIAIGVGFSFATGNALYMLVRESLVTFAFGMLFLGSLLTSRPLIFRLNLDLAAHDSAARAAAEALWERPPARRTFRLITVVWGVGLLLDAVARVVVAFSLPIAAAAAASPAIAFVTIGALIAWTVLYVRAVRRSAAARAEAPG